MIVYYFPNGEIWNAVLDKNKFETTADLNTSQLEIDELPENQSIVLKLSQHATLRNPDGLGRWYIQAGELYERENWSPQNG